MRVIGIDPGVNGAIAVLSKAGSMLDMEPMPESGPIGLLKFFKEEWIGHVFLEKAQAFRGQGVSSSFNYGQHFGELVGMLQVMALPFTLVAPRNWTKQMHMGTSNKLEAKVRSAQAAQRLFPSVNFLRTVKCKKPHDGMIDAILIAEYGRRILYGALSDVRSGDQDSGSSGIKAG